MVLGAAHDRRTVAAVGLDFGVAGQGEEAVDGDGGRLGRREDVHRTAAVVVGSRLGAGVIKDAVFEDQRAGVGGDVAATDGRRLADVGERGDGQSSAADDGSASVVIQAGEGLRARAALDEGDDAGGLVDQTVQRAIAVASAEAEDRRGGVGVDHRAGAREGTDEDARSGDGGVPVRDRGARGVEVKGRALTEGDVGISTQGDSRAGQLDGALIDVGGTGVGAGSGEDDQAIAGLGKRTRATRDQGIDGQRVSRRRATRRDDDFAGGSTEGATGDGGCAGAIIKEHTAGTDGKQATEGKGLGAGQFQGVDGFRSGDGEIGGRKVVRRGRESGGRERGIRREGRSRRTDGEPIDAAKGGPTADDPIGAGGSRGEGDRSAREGDIERGARAAGGEGGESQRGRTAADSDGLDGSLAGRGRQRAEGLGARGSRGAFVTEDTTGGVAEGIDIEDDRAGVRQDIDVG